MELGRGGEQGSGRTDKDIAYPLLCSRATEMGYVYFAIDSALPNANKSGDNSVQGLKGNTDSLQYVHPQRRQVEA